MIYVVYYRNADYQPCIRKLTRGFACLPSELPQEIKTACRASNTPRWELYGSEAGADEVIDHIVRSYGYINETPRGRYNANDGRQMEVA